MSQTISSSKVFAAVYCYDKTILDQYLNNPNGYAFTGSTQPGAWLVRTGATITAYTGTPTFSSEWTPVLVSNSPTTESISLITSELCLNQLIGLATTTLGDSHGLYNSKCVPNPAYSGGIPPIRVMLWTETKYTSGVYEMTKLVPHGQVLLSGAAGFTYKVGTSSVSLSLFPQVVANKSGNISSVKIDGVDYSEISEHSALSITGFTLYAHVPAAISLNDLGRFITPSNGSTVGYRIRLQDEYMSPPIELTASSTSTGYNYVMESGTGQYTVGTGAYREYYPHVSSFIKYVGTATVVPEFYCYNTFILTLYDLSNNAVCMYDQEYSWLMFSLSPLAATVKLKRKMIAYGSTIPNVATLLSLPDLVFSHSASSKVTNIRVVVEKGYATYGTAWADYSGTAPVTVITKNLAQQIQANTPTAIALPTFSKSLLDGISEALLTNNALTRFAVSIYVTYLENQIEFVVGCTSYLYFGHIGCAKYTLTPDRISTSPALKKITAASFILNLPIRYTSDVDITADFKQGAQLFNGASLGASFDGAASTWTIGTSPSTSGNPSLLRLTYSLASELVASGNGTYALTAGLSLDVEESSTPVTVTNVNLALTPNNTSGLNAIYNLDGDVVSTVTLE